MNYPEWLLKIIRCPKTKQILRLENNFLVRNDGFKYPIIDGYILSLVYPYHLSENDKKWNKFYNFFSFFYDITQIYLGKLIFGVDVKKANKEIICSVGFQKGMKVLEVSPGTGNFSVYIKNVISKDGELVVLDLSLNMLRMYKIKNKNLNTYIIHGNAMFLPFADDSFDALFHFGGINLFSEPQKALDEFIRVVKKGGLVCWGDERFSENIGNDWKKKLMLKINPGYLKNISLIPHNLINIKEYNIYNGYAYLMVGTKI